VLRDVAEHKPVLRPLHQSGKAGTVSIVIYIGSALFLLLALGLLITWWRSRHPGALLLAVTYAVAAALALVLHTWWPLVIGFLSAWSLRLMGLDPGGGADAEKTGDRAREPVARDPR
jgi:hypothetical protein